MLKPQCDAGAPRYNPFPRHLKHTLAVSTADTLITKKTAVTTQAFLLSLQLKHERA
jgi:hypothetical protein